MPWAKPEHGVYNALLLSCMEHLDWLLAKFSRCSNVAYKTEEITMFNGMEPANIFRISSLCTPVYLGTIELSLTVKCEIKHSQLAVHVIMLSNTGDMVPNRFMIYFFDR